MKILIADTDPTSRAFLASLLENWGYAVETAADETDARQKLKETDAPRLALIDWRLSGLKGADNCRRLRDETGTTPLHLILMAEGKGGQGIAQAIAAGADDCLLKPCETEELRVKLALGSRMVELQAAALRTESLQEAMQTVRSICHDLNQPLQAVSGYAELLMMKTPKDAPQHAALNRIVESIDRVGGLVERIANVARSAPNPLSHRH